MLQWWAVFLCIVSAEVTLLVKLSHSDSSLDLVAGVCIITFLLALTLRIEDLLEISGGKDGISATLVKRVSKVEHGIKESQKRVDKMYLLSMGPEVYNNLEKIASDNFGEYTLFRGGGFDDELHYLRNIGYIKVKNGKSFGDIPEKGEQLSHFVEITATGNEFLKLRRSIPQQ